MKLLQFSSELVLYDDLYNRVEYLVFVAFFPTFPLSDLDSSLPLHLVLIIILFVYILTLLVSNKPVSEHKFENKYFVNISYLASFIFAIC